MEVLRAGKTGSLPKAKSQPSPDHPLQYGGSIKPPRLTKVIGELTSLQSAPPTSSSVASRPSQGPTPVADVMAERGHRWH